MANESVANPQDQAGPYLGDVLLDAWNDVRIPGYLKFRLAALHRAVSGSKALSAILQDDDNGRGQMADGAQFKPLTSQQRWGSYQALKQLLEDAIFELENLPDELKRIVGKDN